MAQGTGRKLVTALEPVLLFVAVAAFAAILAHGLITGWVWIPGSRQGGGGVGHWASRDDDLGSYVVYLVIVGAAALGALAMAMDRLSKFNNQHTGRQ